MKHQLNEWAGITCEGDAVLILEGSNDVKGFYEENPGIHVSENKTLTIKGEGSLTAASNGYGAGIGGGRAGKCGCITIKHTVTKVTATRGRYATYSVDPGVKGSCGKVTIGDDVALRSEPTYTYP